MGFFRLAGSANARRAFLAIAAGVFLAFGVSGAQLGASAQTLAYSLAIVGQYGGEPSFISDHNGVLYDTSPSGACISSCGTSNEVDVPPIYRSTDKGATWQRIQEADNNSGDDCLGTDEANNLYWCNLASNTAGAAPLQADDWSSRKASTCGTTGCNWVHGAGAVPQTSTSSNPFGVDRDWTTAFIPSGQPSDTPEVILMYHDFYGPSQIWVNISKDGGKNFGPPMEVLASPAVTPGNVAGTLVAQGYTFCNTVPAGVTVIPHGKPHAGRIIVGWIAADLAQNATGCNLTMLEAFHTAWVSYSDDNGSTWTAQQVIDMGIGHDLSTPFMAMTEDPLGNQYVAWSSQGMNQNPAVCAAESAAGTLQGDASCEYNMYVAWSGDGGATWNGGGGTIPGSATAPYQVNPVSETGTHFFPTIAALSPTQVDVGYLRTPTIIPTDALGKAEPGSCAGPTPSIPATATYPPKCDWYLFGGQSVNLTSPPASATWTTAQLTPHPMHYGDICNLGIACVSRLGSNRNLLDFNQEAIDPTTGCAHIGYADDNAGSRADPKNPSPYGNHLVAANQTSGCVLGAAVTNPTTGTTTATPNTGGLPPARPAWPLLGLGGLLAAAAVMRRRRGADA